MADHNAWDLFLLDLKWAIRDEIDRHEKELMRLHEISGFSEYVINAALEAANEYREKD